MIDSVLIANRGEIAVRVMATCRRLGVRTIGVYSDADANALHVARADEAYRIGPPSARESYLNAEAILAVAKKARAAAVHPGYGFLSENPEFARACIDAGLTWIGPSPEAMEAIGDKAHAKALAEQHNVPVLSGYHGTDQSVAVLQREAERIGLPLLIKASAGGGGRGMRIVQSLAEFTEALEAAKREALGSFGDDRVLLERYVKKPRHVEVQILGDQHGHLVHLGERECSIQRRHQKLIEESPSPAVDDAVRSDMGSAAVRLARAAGYSNAGTVEFLLDEEGKFYFLEVNARLQVEHPVTELVTGLDLVELQVRVAAGEPLPFSQHDVQLKGHAIEARVIAEDPLAGFLPSSGTLTVFDVPYFVRTDTGVRAGSVVSPYYDSLLAKLISHEATRSDALRKLAHALQEVQIDGVRHNTDLLLSTIEHPAFAAGDLHTGFLEEHRIIDEVASLPDEVLAAAAALDFVAPELEPDPWRGLAAWRIGRSNQPSAWLRAGRQHDAMVTSRLDGTGVDVATTERTLSVRLLDREGPLRLSVDGRAIVIFDHTDWLAVEWQGKSYRLQRPRALSIEDTIGDRGAAAGSGRLTAPMPGRIVKIAVELGQQVRSNQPLVVLEAMKMEHVVEAPHSGTVKELCVEVGQQVGSGAVLLELGDEG